jgi:hypothetical protein
MPNNSSTNPIYEIAVFVDKMKGRFNFPVNNIRLARGFKSLSVLAMLTYVFYNLFSFTLNPMSMELR